jgi:class 3 adenylate cyclase
MPDLPSGTVTFLFTDIEGSTALWEQDRKAMANAVERHLTLLSTAIKAHGGVLFKVVGDATQAAFPNAPDATATALEAQRALLTESWPADFGSLRVRMALHAGEAVPRNGDYLAAPLNRLVRLLAAGHGTQILLTEVVERLVTGALPTGVSLRPLGSHRLRDLFEPEEVFQVVAPGLPDQFPPLLSLPRHPTNLAPPAHSTHRA